MYNIISVPTDDGRRVVPVTSPGDFIRVLHTPDGVTMRVGSSTAPPIPIHGGDTFRDCAGWQNIYFDMPNIAGETVELLVGDGATLNLGSQEVLLDSDGRQFVRLADRLDHTLDSILPFVEDAIEAHHALRGDLEGRLALAAGGSHGNLWDAAAVGVGENSAAVDLDNLPNVTVFGNSDTAATLTIQVSQDGANFYDFAAIVLSAPGDFAASHRIGARYVRLSSDTAATITATAAGKS